MVNSIVILVTLVLKESNNIQNSIWTNSLWKLNYIIRIKIVKARL